MDDLPRRFGKYLLVRRMAVGGMAEIFLAVEKSPHGSHRFVTIKRIKADFDCDDEYVQFFLTEGRVSLKCAHPNLPQAFEMGAVDGNHYLALEYIHGHTLLDVVRAAAKRDRPLSIETAVHVGVCVAAALEHAHGLRDVDGQSLRIVHRDVTPQNMMVSLSGTVKLIDFGIVRSAVQTHRTASGVVKGKFSYMAPESLTAGREFDQRADLFALGIVLHETLTGRSLFRGVTDNDTLRRVCSMPIPDVSRLRPDTPRSLAALIARALERDPDRRFQTATEFLQALENAAEEAHIHRSVTRLRDEVLDRCGDPPFPTLADDERALLDDTRPGQAGSLAAPETDLGAIRVAESSLPDVDDAAVGGLDPVPPAAAAWAAPVPAPTAPTAVSAPLLPIATPFPLPAPTAWSAPAPPARPDDLPAAVAAPVAERDPQLAYFLRQARITPSVTRRAGREPLAASDPELAELLAALDR